MPANDCVPFFPSDYRGDPGVESLDFDGRGLWNEMYILMMMTEGVFSYAGTPIRETDLALIAKATRGDIKAVRRILPAVKASGVYSVTEDGVIFSRKLVEHFAKKKKKSAAGKVGGVKSAQANAQARAQAQVLKQTIEQDRQAHSVPLHSDPSPSARDNAGARTREAALKSPAFEFCSWMLDEGLKAGVVPAHHDGDHFAWCYRHIEAAETIIATYGEDEGRLRAQRLIAGKLGRRIRREYSPTTLLDVWDWDEIKGAYDLPNDGKTIDDILEGR